jgi:hypothetical protein
VEKGVEIIEKSGLNVREVTGILDSLLGGKSGDEPKPELQPDAQKQH